MAEERFISKHTSTEIEAMLDKVKQDMQVIQFTQSEINTLLGKIQNMQQPTNTSDLTNDSGFITNVVNDLVNYYTKTQTYTKEEINTLMSQVVSGGFEPVNELPTENISTSKIYLVPSTNSGTNNIKDEYINLDGTSNGWELIGSTQLDLSNYVSVTALNSALLDYVTSTGLTNILNDYYTKTQADSLFNGKADKVSGAISGHLAALDSNGNLTDAGKALSDLQGRFDYSLDEKVVGTWFGKPLYQKSFVWTTALTNASEETFSALDIGATVDKIVFVKGILQDSSSKWTEDMPFYKNEAGTQVRIAACAWPNNTPNTSNRNKVAVFYYGDCTWCDWQSITIRYTKTTD